MRKRGGLGSTLSLWEEDLAIMFLFGGCGLSRGKKSPKQLGINITFSPTLEAFVFLYLSLSLKHKKMWGKKSLTSLGGSVWLKEDASDLPGCPSLASVSASGRSWLCASLRSRSCCFGTGTAGEQIGKAQGGWSRLTSLPRSKTEMH